METGYFMFVLLLILAMLEMDICRPTEKIYEMDFLDILNATNIFNTTETIPSSVKEDTIPLFNNSFIIENATDIDGNHIDQLLYNKTENTVEIVRTKVQKGSGGSYRPKKELPMGMIIAGPAAILGIILFLCFTYYCHASQLRREAKTYSIALYVTMEDSTDSSSADLIIPPSEGQRQSPPTLAPPKLQRENSGRLQRENSGRLQRENSSRLQRENSRKPSTLSVPAPHHKRGNSWSSLDQDMFSAPTPRRHSSFIM